MTVEIEEINSEALSATEEYGGTRVTIAPSGDPYLGERFLAVTGTGAPAGAAGFVIVGTVADPGSQQFGVTIYVDLNDPATVIGNLVADETGTGAYQIPVPDDPSLLGVSFHFQLLWVDPAGPQGFSASERMTVVPYAP